MFWILFSVLFLPLLILFPVKVLGKKNYDKKKNYIIVSNHQSALDPILLDMKFKKRIRFIAKKELWKGKEKSFLFDNVLGCLPVDRAKGLSLQITKKIFSIIDQKQNVGIFPEGTRNKHGEEENLTEIKNGACIFAIKTKTPILPCLFINRPKVFKRNFLLIGKPFELNDFYDKKLDKNILNEAGEILLNKLNLLREEFNLFMQEKKIIKNLKKDKKKI